MQLQVRTVDRLEKQSTSQSMVYLELLVFETVNSHFSY